MTRQELIEQAAEDFAGINYDIETKADSLYHYVQKEAFSAGAEWADEHPSPAWVEKACRFLFDNYHGEKLSLRMIEKFRKYMEEEQ